MLAAIARFTRSSFAIPRDQWWMACFVGIFDIAGNIFYVLSARAGRMDIAAVIGSLYPGATVVLAWGVLKEKISISQWIGIAAVLTAIALISA